ncbi:MAG: transglutaminase domain-containing protein, partial [Actinomycetota bacterium]|nr:transglutaminase domain-containing protein [Actinomycetota bacterium]
GLALEAWFRSDAFEYTTDIDPGHAATDLAEWLLPENSDSPNFRRGYCENFATSMAVLARTLAIPSRVVLGFTPGRPTAPGGDTVVVTDRNAHAWVELWMPAQGWVRFDPTPRPDGANPSTMAQITTILGFDPTEYLDEIEAPELEVSGLPPGGGIPLELEGIGDLGAEGGGSGGVFNLPNWVLPMLVAGAGLLVLFGGLPLVKRLRSRRRWARLRSGDIGAAWEEIVASLTDYGHSPAPSMTPAELARSTDPAMVPLAMVYGQAVYGPPRPPSTDHRRVAEQSLLTTTDQLAQRHSRWQRLRALYSPASLLAGLRRRR